MPGRDFNTAIEGTKGLDADMSEDADRRLRARLAGGPPRPRRVRWGRVGAVGTVVALGLVLSLRPAAPMDSLGGFAVAERSAEFSATASADLVTIAAGRCLLRDDGLGSAMQVEGAARLRRLADGVELAEGTVSLDVDHRRERARPFRVRVSHGSIEVLGTRFIVTQREGGGEVTLHRGSIQFRADDGQVRLLTPGQSVRWPLPPLEPEPTKTPTAVEPPQRSRVTPKAVDAPVEERKPFEAAALLERIALLRSRGEYEAAVTALAEALREQHAPVTDERLSFELGAILSRQLQDPPRACAHWQAHRARFAGGRYEEEVGQARASLHCEQP